MEALPQTNSANQRLVTLLRRYSRGAFDMQVSGIRSHYGMRTAGAIPVGRSDPVQRIGILARHDSRAADFGRSPLTPASALRSDDTDAHCAAL